ncbi:MAG: VOC family protein [Myxococcota bacterium]
MAPESPPKHSNPPEGWPQISSCVVYERPVEALAWLEEAFGFATRVRVEDGDGRLVHSELELGSGLVMLSGVQPQRRFQSPRALGGQNTQSLYVFVDDVDAHCRRARAAGATILQEPETRHYGDRLYGCLDCEGHTWFFGQRLADPQPPGHETETAS